MNEYIKPFVVKFPQLEKTVLEEFDVYTEIVPYYDFFAFVIEPLMEECISNKDKQNLKSLFFLVEEFLSEQSVERDDAISNTVFEGFCAEIQKDNYDVLFGTHTASLWKEFLENPF